MKKLTSVFVIAFFMVNLHSWAQSAVVADSLSQKGKELIEKQIDKQLTEKLAQLYWLTGIAIAGISVYAVITGVFRLKKLVDKAIQNRAEKLVEEAIQKNTGLKLEELQAFFTQQRELKATKENTRIAIMNNRGVYNEIRDSLKRQGYKTDDYRLVQVLPTKEDLSKCDVLVLDNTNDHFTEAQVVEFLKNHFGNTKLVYLANSDLSPEHFQEYRNKVKIVKLIDRLGDAINQAIS